MFKGAGESALEERAEEDGELHRMRVRECRRELEIVSIDTIEFE